MMQIPNLVRFGEINVLECAVAGTGLVDAALDLLYSPYWQRRALGQSVQLNHIEERQPTLVSGERYIVRNRKCCALRNL